MKKEQLPLGAIAFVVLIAGLAFAGVPTSTLWFLLLVLACPLMMMFMMRGMSGMAETRKQDPDADARLAQLEQEVAELRAAKDRAGSGRS